MLETIVIPLLAVHLLAMDLASAGPLVSAGLRWRADEVSRTIGPQLAWWSVSAMVVGMLTGGLLIIVIPGDGLWAALARFPARTYWYAGAELLFSLACMVAIAGGWNRFRKWMIAALAIVAATNLLYHFPPLMAVIGKLAANPQLTSADVIQRPLLLELMARNEVIALSFHFGVSAFAVAAITVLYLLVQSDSGLKNAQGQAIAQGSAGLACVATLVQVPMGVWLLISLPGTSRMALMGKTLVGSLGFMAAMVLSLILLQRLFAAALGDVSRKNLRTIVALTCVVVLLMTTSLRSSRFILPKPEPATKTALSANAQG